MPRTTFCVGDSAVAKGGNGGFGIAGNGGDATMDGGDGGNAVAGPGGLHGWAIGSSGSGGGSHPGRGGEPTYGYWRYYAEEAHYIECGHSHRGNDGAGVTPGT